MPEEPPPGVLGGLPHTRPHRRSDKRPAKTGLASADTATPSKVTRAKSPVSRAAAVKARPSAPAGPPPRSAGERMPPPVRAPGPAPDTTAGPLSTAVQAAAELTEIGLGAGARALRGALARLPRR